MSVISEHAKSPSIIASAKSTNTSTHLNLNSLADIDADVVQLFEKEVSHMKEHLEQKKLHPNALKSTVYVMSSDIRNAFKKYGKARKLTKTLKTYDKTVYSKGMSNFIAFISKINNRLSHRFAL